MFCTAAMISMCSLVRCTQLLAQVLATQETQKQVYLCEQIKCFQTLQALTGAYCEALKSKLHSH